MDPIIITPADLWQVVVAVCGGIIALSGAGAVITSVIHKAKAPNQEQNARIAALEEGQKMLIERLDQGDKRFELDNKKIGDLETAMRSSNKIIVESLQALTAHAIDGNNTDQLRSAEKALNNYLLGKI